MLNQPEFIGLLQAGNQQAFAQLVEEWGSMVYNTALGIVQQEEDADDITQEVFAEVYRSVSSFKGESRLSTWIYRIAVRKALDWEKKRKRKKRFAFFRSLTGDDGEAEIQPAEFNHPGVQLEKKESAAALMKALRTLPDNQRVAFTLQKLEGLSYQEIAAVLEITVQAVESLLARAKKNLKNELMEFYQQNR
ncbi:MAG: RNA polymerase sigma factor [Ferruginibacter sp.]